MAHHGQNGQAFETDDLAANNAGTASPASKTPAWESFSRHGCERETRRDATPPAAALRQPKPEALDPVARLKVRPVRILGVQLGLARVQVGLLRLDPARALDDLPDKVQAEEDGDADVRREEACCPVLSYILDQSAQ